MKPSVFFIVCTLLAPLPPVVNQDPNQADLDAIQGTWELIRSEYSGKENPIPDGQRIEIAGDRFKEWNVHVKRPHIDFSKITIVSTPLQRRFHRQIVDSEADEIRGKILPCIFKIEGEQLIYANRGASGEWPDSFDGKGVSMYVFRRVP